MAQHGEWHTPTGAAYLNDGTPLGSAGYKECLIDSIAQSWSVLSGIAAPERAQQAMDTMHASTLDHVEVVQTSKDVDSAGAWPDGELQPDD